MARPSITQLPPTGLDRFRGLLTRADDLSGGLLAAVPGIGTLAALNRSGNAAQTGDYTKAVESLADVVPVGRLATRAIKGLTKGRSTGDVGGVMNIAKPNYQGSHSAPDKEYGAPLNDLSRDMYPADVYSAKGLQYYGSNSPGERESLDVARKVRGNPDAMVTVYRAAPQGMQTDINAGDWITPSKAYAKYHAENVIKGQQGQDYEILSKKVPAKHVYTDANSLAEYGYDPTGLGIQGGLLGSSTDSRALNQFEYPQQAALDLAQKRAALPVSEGGLGLPPDNTPMDRARALGYDVDNPLYHGTNKDITAFNPNAGEAAREMTGTNLSKSPEIANSYAGRPDGNVMPVLAKTKGFDEIDFEGNNWNQLPPQAVLRQRNGDEDVSDYFDTMYEDISTNDIGRLSRRLGAPGLLINDVADRGGYVRGVGDVPATTDNMMVFDPSRIRSRFAAFDPFRRNEADLLAFGGNMGGTTLGNINPLLGLLDDENQ